MNENVWPLILLGGGLLAFLLVVSFLSKNYSLNNFKSKTVGDGQHGTARWATPKEIHTTYHVVPFRPRRWRKGEDLPTVQGIILGSIIAPIAGIARVCAQPAWLCAFFYFCRAPPFFEKWFYQIFQKRRAKNVL